MGIGMKTDSFSLRKKVALTASMASILLAVSFLGMEFYTRTARPSIDVYEMTGKKPGKNPMSEWAFIDAYSAFKPKPGQYSKGKTVNSQGFISTPELTIEKPDGTFRIVFLGGSSTAGTGTDLVDEETWPWKTINLLRAETGAKIDFINGAVGGYTSFESYGRLWSRIRHFNPDLIVVYHGWNEMYYFSQVDSITSWRTLDDGSWSFDTTDSPITYYQPLWVDKFIRFSQFLTRVRLRLSHHVSGENAAKYNSENLDADFDRRGLDVWKTNLQFVIAAAETIGAKYLVAKQATLIVEGLPETERERCRYEYHGFDHDAHVRAFAGIYQIIDDVVPVDSIVDLTNISGVPDYFYDHVHLTSSGASEVARLISAQLVRLLD